MITVRGMMEYFTDHPGATNGEVAEALDCDSDAVRHLLSRYKARGEIETTTLPDGKRVVKVLRDISKKSYDFKKCMLMDMCETYYNDFLKAELYSERVEIGKMICRILEKI